MLFHLVRPRGAGTLAGGGLFDAGRFPALTLLAGLGLLLCLWRWRRDRYRLPGVLSLAWLLLYFGRPTWGAAGPAAAGPPHPRAPHFDDRRGDDPGPDPAGA